jgi:alanyl-tRNA synthetase
MLSVHDIRKKYLDFFAAREHQILPSASLVPENDPSTLFTGSGMQPMVPFLLGEPHPMGKRLADSQKCFRSQDIEEVGDNRHTTFFEMLGNWSLGNYFKQDQIPWMFEFLTKEVGLDARKLYVSVFRGNDSLGIPRDEEAVQLWQKCFSSVGIDAQAVDFAERDGMKNGRIFYYPEKKNWWSRAGVPDNMPVGEPGGPDTEMFWDFGIELGLHEVSQWKTEPCHVNCDCGRFMEIGNNVFMQYRKTETGFEKLPQQNVDFGGGLERIAAAANNNPDVFLVDLFKPVIDFLESKMTGQKYTSHHSVTRNMRVVADHARAAVFLIADGVAPSNKDQGYVLRRVLRRAIFGLEKLQIGHIRLLDVASIFIKYYTQVEEFAYLQKKEKDILSTIEGEINKFTKSLALGEREFEKIVSKNNALTPQEAFLLYQSYGFPWELTYEMVTERGITVDRAGFEDEFKKHQEKSRSVSDQKFAGGLADHSVDTTKLHTATHLLHQALRQVLGEHVEQRGSNITAERLRFDFSHNEKMTPEQIKQVEDIVNEQIKRDLTVHAEQLTVEEAKARGAIGLFEDKYAQIGGKINVYFMGDFSKEICGGPHVERTGQLGGIKIQKEEASSAGVRRIKAILG